MPHRRTTPSLFRTWRCRPRAAAALAAAYPALYWCAACGRARALRGQLAAARAPGQRALLAAGRSLLGAATRAGMRRAFRHGQSLALGGPLPRRVDGLLEAELFRLDAARCPAEYRAALLLEQRLEEALLRRAPLPDHRRLEDLFALWEDLHRLACFAALYLGFEQRARRLAAAQPWRRAPLEKRAAALRALLGMGERQGKLVYFPASAHAAAT